MRNLVVFALLLNALLLAGRLWQELPVMAQKVDVDPVDIRDIQNGNVNGDDKTDVSDVIFLAAWLFQGGPAPVACADSSGLVARVAALEALANEQGELINSLQVALNVGQGALVSADATGRLSEVQAVAATGDTIRVVGPVALGALEKITVRLAQIPDPGEFDVSSLNPVKRVQAQALLAAQRLNTWISEASSVREIVAIRVESLSLQIQRDPDSTAAVSLVGYLRSAVADNLKDIERCATGKSSQAATAELTTYLQAMEEQLRSVGDDAQLANIDLQNMLQKQQQTLQMMSNISKMLHDTAMAVIRKIG